MRTLIIIAVAAVIVLIVLDEERETRRRYTRVQDAERDGIPDLGIPLEGLGHVDSDRTPVCKT